MCVYVFASEKIDLDQISHPAHLVPPPHFYPRTRSVASQNRERKCLKQYKIVHLRLKSTRAATLAASSCFMNYQVRLTILNTFTHYLRRRRT